MKHENEIETGAPADLAVRKRENTRARLVRAGRRLFFSQPYTAISVDRIAREAGFTRAAFYLHFSSKDELVADIIVNEVHKSEPVFAWFESHPRTRESATAFVHAFLKAAGELWAGKLFHIASLQSDAALRAYAANRAWLMAVLGRGFPAFRPAQDESAEEMERIASATMIVIVLEQMAIRESEIWDGPMETAMIGWVADAMMALDRRFPG